MRLPATSVVESITAMVIILLSFGVGMMIYMNVIRSEKILSKTQANLILNQLMDKSINESLFFDDKIQIGGLSVNREVKAYSNFQDVFVVRLMATNPKGEIILTQQELVFNTPEK